MKDLFKEAEQRQFLLDITPFKKVSAIEKEQILLEISDLNKAILDIKDSKLDKVFSFLDKTIVEF